MGMFVGAFAAWSVLGLLAFYLVDRVLLPPVQVGASDAALESEARLLAWEVAEGRCPLCDASWNDDHCDSCGLDVRPGRDLS